MFTLACCLLLARPVYAQTDGAGSIPCRMAASQLLPLLHPDNPSVANHTWDDIGKLESATLPGGRVLLIEQSACIRHHIRLVLLCPQQGSYTTAQARAELQQMLDAVFEHDASYLAYRQAMATELQRALVQLKQPFQFHIDERSFGGMVEQQPQGWALRFEMVRMLHSQQIKQPGVAEYDDDGWRSTQRGN